MDSRHNTCGTQIPENLFRDLPLPDLAKKETRPRVEFQPWKTLAVSCDEHFGVERIRDGTSWPSKYPNWGGIPDMISFCCHYPKLKLHPLFMVQHEHEHLQPEPPF